MCMHALHVVQGDVLLMTLARQLLILLQYPLSWRRWCQIPLVRYSQHLLVD